MTNEMKEILDKNGFDAKRIPLAARVCKYEKGLEDGFATYVDVVTNAHIFSDNIVSIDDGGVVKCPYVNNKRGRTFVLKGDYIVFEEDGSKHVMSEEALHKRFEIK